MPRTSVHAELRPQPLLAQDCRVLVLVQMKARGHPVGHRIGAIVQILLVGDLDGRHEELLVGIGPEQDVLTAAKHLREIQAGAGVVHEEAIDDRLTVSPDVRLGPVVVVVHEPAEPAAARVAVPIGLGRLSAETVGEDVLRDLRVPDDQFRTVGRIAIEQYGTVEELHGIVAVAGTLVVVIAPRLGDREAFGEHHLLVLRDVTHRVRRIEVVIPGLDGAEAVRTHAGQRDEQLAVPARAFGKDDRHAGAQRHVVPQHSMQRLGLVARLRKHELGRRRECDDARPFLDGVAVERAAEPDLETAILPGLIQTQHRGHFRPAVVDDERLTQPAVVLPDLLAVDLALRHEELGAGNSRRQRSLVGGLT